MSPNFTPLTDDFFNKFDNENNSGVFKIFFYILLFITLMYGYSYFTSLFIPFIFDFTMAKGLTITSKHVFQNFEILSLIAYFATLLFLYLSLKIKHGTKKGLYLSLVALAFIPVIAFVYQNVLLSSLKPFPKEVAIPLPTQVDFRFNFNNPAIALSIVFVFLAIYHRKKFTSQDSPLSKKERIIFISVSFFLLLLLIARLTFTYLRFYDRDYRYTITQKAVNYHLYKPTVLPYGYQYSTYFSQDSSIGELKNAVQVTFDIDLIAGPIRRETIWLRQINVPQDFDLYSFIIKNFKTDQIEKVTLSQSKTATGYFFQQKPLKINILMYITNDDVLIFLASLKLNKDQLINFASLLK